jgi:hypothetical protein
MLSVLSFEFYFIFEYTIRKREVYKKMMMRCITHTIQHTAQHCAQYNTTHDTTHNLISIVTYLFVKREMDKYENGKQLNYENNYDSSIGKIIEI